jgi:hypothetical protein
MVNGYACGLGIRETDGLITTNTSRFVPHRIEGKAQEQTGITSQRGSFKAIS